MNQQSGLYRALSIGPLAKSYRGKLMAVAIVSISLPAICAIILMYAGVSPAVTVAALVICVAAAIGLCAWAFDALLEPLRRTSDAMHQFGDRSVLPDLPISEGDLAAELMANAQRGMVMLDEVRRQRAVDRTTDPITGLINTRSAVRRLGADILRAERDARPMCIALIEIDNLEALAQKFGHDSVDAIAKTVSNVVVGAVRRSDWVANHASHQFLVGLWGVRPEAAQTALSRVADHLRSKGKYPVSLSIGIAAVADKESPDKLIANASNAMARARKAGGNQIVAAD